MRLALALILRIEVGWGRGRGAGCDASNGIEWSRVEKSTEEKSRVEQRSAEKCRAFADPTKISSPESRRPASSVRSLCSLHSTPLTPPFPSSPATSPVYSNLVCSAQPIPTPAIVHLSARPLAQSQAANYRCRYRYRYSSLSAALTTPSPSFSFSFSPTASAPPTFPSPLFPLSQPSAPSLSGKIG